MVNKQCVVIGGGPAGLMAAEQLTQSGYAVDLYDAMPTVGRKFLLAGLGGLNITHSEPYEVFCARYAQHQAFLQPILACFTPTDLRQWCDELGIDTFVGTSGRVFPEAMKAAPLLRKWLARLRENGLTIYPKHRWTGWDDEGNICLQSPQGELMRPYDVLILALGGGSWKKLGSDGQWLPLLQAQAIEATALLPSNCGFLSAWSDHLKQNFAGAPLKSVAIRFTDIHGDQEKRIGECILTEYGIEGSLIYAFSARLRDAIYKQGSATFYLDLCPNHTAEQLHKILSNKPKNKTLSTYLKSRLKLDAVKRALLFEVMTKQALSQIDVLTATLQNLPITVSATTPIDEAISTAGGVLAASVNENLMLKNKKGVFCAGEMLDWDAPTGGYLLTACMALGKQAGCGAVGYLGAGS
ncbi:MAG: TIGR03862 family flavoprotein [Leucothrix sp.]